MVYIKKHILLNSILFFATLIILIFPAIINGYPLLHIDSAAHISSGQIGEIRIDASFIYSLFLRHISLSWSLWLPILMQAILLSYALLLLLKTVTETKKVFFVHFLLVLLLFFTTGISYYTSLILPEIFSSISIISFIVLLLIKKKEKFHFCIISVIFGFSVITSYSNIRLLIIVSVLAIMFISFFWGHFHSYFKRICYILMVTFTSLFFMALISYCSGAGFQIQRAKSINVSAQLVSLGISQKYLESYCNEMNSSYDFTALCNNRELLDNSSRSSFLYSPTSPLYVGCENKDWQECWLQKNDTHNKLIGEILSHNNLLADFLVRMVSRTLKQLIIFSADDLPPVGINSEISRFYEEDNYSYQHSVQRFETLSYSSKNVLQIFMINGCLIGIVFLLLKHGDKMHRKLYLILIIGFSALFFNALVYAVFSDLSSIAQGKLIFIIPVLFFVLLLRHLKLRKYNRNFDLSMIL